MPYFGVSAKTFGFGATAKDTFSGDGSTVAFTLSQTSATNDVEVFVGNVQQEPTVAYSISGSTLTFTEAPPTGTNNIYVLHRSRTRDTILPPADLGDKNYAMSGALSVTGNVTTTGNLKINDGANIGSASDADAISISSTGVTTFSQRDIHSGGITIADGGEIGSASDANAITIASGGGVTFAEVANVDKGIKFPATQVASTNVNTLDDYEEGTYTPTISFGGNSVGVAYGLQDGNYSKIGRMVKIDFRITLTNKGSSTGVARISLPFTASALTRSGSQVIPYGINFNAYADTTAVNASLVGQGAVAGTATADLYLITTGASLTQVNISNNSDFIGNLLYIAT